MLLFFLPPVVQVAIGIVVVVIGVALHMVIITGIGVVGLAIGATRFVRSRRSKALPR
jgi:hypothetical protein